MKREDDIVSVLYTVQETMRCWLPELRRRNKMKDTEREFGDLIRSLVRRIILECVCYFA